MYKKTIYYYISATIAAGFLIMYSMTGYAKTVKALFLGNSYTYTNNLPQTIAELALSAGDTFLYESNAPGGYTLQQHCTNSTTLSLIEAGDWDYIILQEQSQLPSFPDEQVVTDVYPYARKLDSLVKAYNDCAKTVFYVTWGRKNGDAMNCGVFPPVCTYEGMDSLLQLRYAIMADSNNSLLSPVANVWRRIRTDHPEIELYNTDESHPSTAGTFAAACTFYGILFQKDPVACTFSGTIGTTNANIIKHASQNVVYDSLAYWSRFCPATTAAFSFTVTDGAVAFNNLSEHADTYTWYFGDGNTATDASPVHSYTSTGSYEVMLVAHHCADSDTITQVVNITALNIDDIHVSGKLRLYPNPVTTHIYIQSPVPIEQVLISDLEGRTVIRHNYSSEVSVAIDVKTLTPGTYLIRSVTTSGIYTSRFIRK